jgi:hypothetical protein
MKRLLTLCLSFFCVLASVYVTAQENFQDGYIVLSHQDTVRGQIDFRDWVASPRQISFRDLSGGKKTTYLPEALTAFFVNGEVYRSYTVRVTPYTREASQAAEDVVAAPYDSTLFLRLVTGGKLSLYFYQGSDITYFFIQRQAAIPEQLLISTTEVKNNGLNSIVTEELYKNQLTGWLADCPATARRAAGAVYTEHSLHKLIFAYNNCGKDTVERRETGAPQGKAVSFMPLLGYFHSSLHVTGSLYESRMSWPSDNSVTGGVGMQLVLPRARQKFAFFMDVLYRHYKSQGSVLVVDNGLTEQGVFDYDQVQVDFQFRYRFPTAGRVRPFLNIGASGTTLFNNKSYQDQHDVITDQHTLLPMFGFSGDMKTSQFGLIGGGGIQAGRFSLEARIEKSDGLSSVNEASATLTNFYLLAGFSF